MDAIHGRSLTFMDLEAARRRWRIGVRQAFAFPDLPAVESYLE